MKNADNKSKKEKRGLYFALAVCLMAVGIAAWGTYNSVSDYVKVKSGGSDTLERQQEDPEAPRPQTTPQPAPESTAPEEPANTQPEVQVPAPDTEIDPEYEDANATAYTMQEDYKYPVASSEVLSPYSGDKLVYNETMRDHRTHDGIDLSASNGETVYAANGGLVKQTYSDLLLGNVVVIEHGEYELWYCGLGETFLVKEGDLVTTSTAIGSVTAVPSEAAPTHLHLQVKKDGSFVDPIALPFAE